MPYIVRRDELNESLLGKIHEGVRLDALGCILADKRNATLQKRVRTVEACKNGYGVRRKM